jgi:hypothetical protein
MVMICAMNAATTTAWTGVGPWEGETKIGAWKGTQFRLLISHHCVVRVFEALEVPQVTFIVIPGAAAPWPVVSMVAAVPPK